MTQTTPFSHLLRVAHLDPSHPTEIALAPDKSERAAIARDLGIIALPQLRLLGVLRAQSAGTWVFEGRLQARVVQECVVTLEPVETELYERLRRVFSPHITPPEGIEIEMPDEEVEPLGQFIDMGAVATEALALALPLWPRAKGAKVPEEDARDDDKEAQTRKPFAGLADLLKKVDR